MDFTLDHIIVFGYLILTLYIGYIAGRGIKDPQDYAIARKTFGTPILIIAILATEFGGGSTTGGAAEVFKIGIIFTLASLGITIGNLLTARYIAPKLGEKFKGMLTIGDIMQHYYGESVGKTTGFLGTFFSAGFVGAQIMALGYIFELFFNIPHQLGVMIAGGVVVVYSTFGGIKSVTITDVVQFAILIVMIPLVSSVAVNEVGGIGVLLEKTDPGHFAVFEHDKFWQYFFLFITLSLPIMWFKPPLVQRFLMANNTKQLSKMIYMNAFLRLIFEPMIAVVGLSALILFPTITANLAFPTAVDQLLPIGIKGLAIAGILAVIMSTADSNLNSAGVLVTHNFIKHFIKNPSKRLELNLMKLSTLVIGVLSILTAFMNQNIVFLLIMMNSIWAATIAIPMIASLFGMKSSARAFYSGMSSAILALVAWKIFVDAELNYMMPLITIFAGSIGFFGFSFLENGLPKLPKLVWRFAIREFNLIKFIPTPSNICKFSATRVESYGANYVMFGIFASLNYIIPYFMWSYADTPNYPVVLAIRLIAGVLCVLLLLKESWSEKLQKYFPVYWHFTLMFCLPFVTTVLLIMEKAGVEWLVNLALSIFLLALLVDWLSFIIIMILGMSLGYLFHFIFVGDVELVTDFRTAYLAVYIGIFATLIGLIFARKKEFDAAERLETMKLFGGAIAHEVKTPLAATKMTSDMFESVLKDSKDGIRGKDLELIKELSQSLSHISTKGIKTIDMLLTALKSKVIADDVREYSITKCVEEALREYGLSEGEKKRIKFKGGKDFTFYGSKYFMLHLLFNLIKNALRYTQIKSDAKITIWLEANRLHFKDTGIGIGKEDLPHIFERFYTKSKTGTGIGLAFCHMVMEEIGGEISCSSKYGQYTEFVLEFPKHSQ